MAKEAFPYDVLKVPVGLGREAWHNIRAQGLGGSDAAVVAGISPFKSPLRLWMEKTGAMDREDLDGVQRVQWGSLLEGPVADYYAQQHPTIKVRRVNGVLRSRAFPFMLANLDRRVLCPDRGRGTLEVKTTSGWNATAWDMNEDNPLGVPKAYQLQVQHYMAVTGDQFADVAVLVGGQDYQEREIPRDQDLIDALTALEGDFWQLVQDGIMPALTGSGDEGAALLHLFPNGSDEEVLDLSRTDAIMAVSEYLVARDTIAQAKAVQDVAKATLKAMMGEHVKGMAGNTSVAWARFPKASVDMKALTAAHPALVAQFTTSKPSERFNVTPGKASKTQGETNV